MPFTRLAEEERQVHGEPGIGNGPRALAIDAMQDAARGELRDGEIVNGCHCVDNILRFVQVQGAA